MSGLPAAATKVGNQSRPEKRPFCTVSGGMWPGQRAMQGTRKPPSMIVPLDCANGVVPPSGQVKSSVPLSVVNTTIVLSSSPKSLSFFRTKPMSRSEEHTSELQSRQYLVCRLLLEKKKRDRCSQYASIV